MTPLEILTPYLPYGIDVQVQYEDGHPAQTGRLEMLGAVGEGAAKVRYADGFARWENLPAVKPVLKSFSALVEPLEDGTVPLYEYVRFMWTKETDMRHAIYGDIIEVHGSTALYMAKRSDFEAGRMHGLGTAYLRRHHFAVGLAPDQFVEKV